jgi:hypothetical protein
LVVFFYFYLKIISLSNAIYFANEWIYFANEWIYFANKSKIFV